MHRIALVLSYFGRFNEYFPLWLHSCRENPTVDWLVFTDDRRAFDYPLNVKVFYTTFHDIRKRIQELFDFRIGLRTPYGLCSYKVAYGDVFREYLDAYDFWGHCDCDVIWGDIRRFLPESILQAYNKISQWGHFTLYRNDPSINRLYRVEVNGHKLCERYFESDLELLFFDEHGINVIFEKKGQKMYTGIPFADLRPRRGNFYLEHLPPDESYKNRRQVFLWEKGRLLRLYLDQGGVCEEEMMYIHFLKRAMTTPDGFPCRERFGIIPNEFIDIDRSHVTPAFLARAGRRRVFWRYWLDKGRMSSLWQRWHYCVHVRARRRRVLEDIHTLLAELQPD